MKIFFMGIVGVFLLSGAVFAGQCYNNVCQQVVQEVVQPVQYQVIEQVVQPQYVQRVVEYVEVPKVRVVEKVRQQVVVQKEVVVQKQQVKVVKQNVEYVQRQPILQRVRQNVKNRVQNAQKVRSVEKIQVINQY